jgi:hypothetical protein
VGPADAHGTRAQRQRLDDVGAAPEAAGREHDRAGVGLAEQFHVQIQCLDVDQTPRPELELQEALAVGARGHFVVDAGRHVAEMCRWHLLAHHRLEIEGVDGHARRSDQLVERARAPHRGIGQALFLRQHVGRAGHQRTGREILQETTAGCELIDHVLPDRGRPARS